MNISLSAVIIGLMAAIIPITNLLVNLSKKVFTIKKPQIVVLITALALSIISACGIAVWQGFNVWWQFAAALIGAVLIGCIDAYGAMFGYDELYTTVIEIFKKFIEYVLGRSS